MSPVPSLEDPGEPGRRTYVLDTNVLLYDPNALTVFEDNDLVIPITVIEEIDRFKKDLNETGRNARSVSRQLDGLRHAGSLSRGVPLPGGGTLRVEMPPADYNLPPGFGPNSHDNHILSVVVALARRAPRGAVVFVTRDTNMRIKADALSVPTEDYEHAHISFDESYAGVCELEVDGPLIDRLYQDGQLELDGARGEELVANEFVVLKAAGQPRKSALARWRRADGRLQGVPRFSEGVWGIRARNKEQLFALDLLMDDAISLVTLDGVAGTGKTLMAIAAGLQRVADAGSFRRLVVSRPIFPLGRDLGYLPGDVGEKLNPWMKPIFDNLDLLVGDQRDDADRRRRSGGQPGYQALIDQGMLEVEPLTYIRGRSMPRQFLLVDEAQNLTPHEVKTVITRAGEGTKIVLTGDPYQIDNPYVDATSNGLTYVIERMKGEEIAGHVTLRKGERSALAELAAARL
ncbi:MAG: PhoH family protein [Deltaproteobacteria bacterium]|nr:MAG: PhoH family protein [Deltaproteobacteria bacterium]